MGIDINQIVQMIKRNAKKYCKIICKKIMQFAKMLAQLIKQALISCYRFIRDIYRESKAIEMQQAQQYKQQIAREQYEIQVNNAVNQLQMEIYMVMRGRAYAYLRTVNNFDDLRYEGIQYRNGAPIVIFSLLGASGASNYDLFIMRRQLNRDILAFKYRAINSMGYEGFAQSFYFLNLGARIINITAQSLYYYIYLVPTEQAYQLLKGGQINGQRN